MVLCSIGTRNLGGEQLSHFGALNKSARLSSIGEKNLQHHACLILILFKFQMNIMKCGAASYPTTLQQVTLSASQE